MDSKPDEINWLGGGQYRLQWSDNSSAIYEPPHESSLQFILQANYSWGFSKAVAWLYENHATEIERCLHEARKVGMSEAAL